MKYFLGTICIVSVIISCQSSTLQNNNINEKNCLARDNQYWYNNVCWNHADEINKYTLQQNNLVAHIDDYVSAYQKAVSQSYIMINGIRYGLADVFWYGHQIDEMRLAVAFSVNGQKHSLLLLQNKAQVVNASYNDVPVTGVYMRGNPIFGDKATRDNVISYGVLQVRVTVSIDENDIDENKAFDGHNQEYTQFITGALKSGDRIVASFSSNIINGGNTDVRVAGDGASISGTMGIQTYIQVKELIQRDSVFKEADSTIGETKIKTLVLKDVFGSSINDPIIMLTGELIRQAGWNVYVPKYSAVESGAILLLVAGVERIIEQDTDIGIHSWCCFLSVDARKLPQEHPTHQYQLKYFTQMLGENAGTQFYFKMLDTASVSLNEIYYMKEDEIKEFNLSTE